MLARTALVAFAVLLLTAPLAVARPGDLDRSFGTRGLAGTTRVDGGTTAFLQRNGRLVVAGGSDKPGVARFTTRGRLDRSFGKRGIARLRGFSTAVFGMTRRPNGSIRLAGRAFDTYQAAVSLASMSAGGRSVRQLHHPGFIPGPIGETAIRAEGGAYVTDIDQKVHAIAPDGSAKTAFGAGGVIDPCEFVPTGPSCVIAGLATAPGSKLLVATVDFTYARPYAILLRYTHAGTVDYTFGRAGWVTLALAPRGVRVGPDGMILAYGELGTSAAIQAFGGSGRRWTSWGDNGWALAGPGSGSGDIQDVTLDRARRAVFLVSPGNSTFPIVMRTASNGYRDPRFGRRGRRGLPRPEDHEAAEGRQVLVDRRNRIIVVGKAYQDGTDDPSDGSCGDFRDDFCATSVDLRVWRLTRR